MSRARRRTMWFMVVGLLMATPLVSLEVLAPWQALTVSRADLGAASEPLIGVPIRPGELVELRYVHSLNKFDVHEQLIVHDDGFLVVGQLINGNGAGIGEVPGEGTFVDAGGGWQRLEGIRRELPQPLLMRAGGPADHRLVVDGREHRLADVAEPGTRLELRLERRGVVRALQDRLTHIRSPQALERGDRPPGGWPGRELFRDA